MTMCECAQTVSRNLGQERNSWCESCFASGICIKPLLFVTDIDVGCYYWQNHKKVFLRISHTNDLILVVEGKQRLHEKTVQLKLSMA